MSEREIAAIAERQHGLIGWAQLRSLGMTRGAVHRRVRSGRWVAMHQCVYRIGGTSESLAQQALGACLCIGDLTVASHRTAAILHDLLGYRAPPLEITTTRDRSPELVGVTTHRIADLQPRWCVVVDGVPCTSIARTLVDLGAVARPDTVGAALDRATGRHEVDVSEVRHAMRAVARKGRAGVGTIRALLLKRGLEVPAGVLEARMRSLIVEAGLPSPIPEYVVRDEHGGFRATVDFAYPDRRLAIEVDGYEAHSPRSAFRDDRARDRLLLDARWVTLRFTWPEVDARLPHVAATIARHYRRRAS